jgi:ferric-dicitrate binding protein FerR (iron transport regulator)
MARVEERLGNWLAHIQEHMQELAKEQAALHSMIEDREDDRRKRRQEERRDATRNRWTMYSGIALVLLTTLGSLIIELVTRAP